MKTRFCASLILIMTGTFLGVSADNDLRSDFVTPPMSFRTRPLWFWNGPLMEKNTLVMMERALHLSGFSGFGILPTYGMTPEFMSPGYLDHYRAAADQAAALGLKLCLYDEFYFPSGSAGGQLGRKYPEALAKRLDLTVAEVRGPQPYHGEVPAGQLMGAVAMRSGDFKRIDITGSVKGQALDWKVPAGTWKIMVFTCVTQSEPPLVDYLDPEAVDRFIELTYQKYYESFPGHFGKTIDSAFYDEPTMSWIEGGRAWTGGFNAKFEKRFGFSPVLYYPALWYDIGPDTPAARNALLGFRADLYADGFVGTIAKWCEAHGLSLTGHHDQEEVVNPVSLSGDLIKSFRNQPIPGIDQIFSYGRSSKVYKVVSSAAANYDRRLVMVECYGAIRAMPPQNLYREAMDQFAKGINFMVPHAAWYNPAKVDIQPELNYTSPVYGPFLWGYNEFMGRLQRILQSGRHVADIAVLYPIAGLQAAYRFGVGDAREGGVTPPEADYLDVGEALSLKIRRDFTFLHPDALDEKGEVEGAFLRLANRDYPETYRVVILPGSKVIRWSNLEKIRRFHEGGGIVIATTALPEASAEFGKDRAVQKAITDMFGSPPPESGKAFRTRGRAYFIPEPSPAKIRAALNDALPLGDVAFEPAPEGLKGGNLSYIHKVVDDREVYFFANSSDQPVECKVRLRGRFALELWDPHTGRITGVSSIDDQVAGQPSTLVHLSLPPVRSMFLVSIPDRSDAET